MSDKQSHHHHHRHHHHREDYASRFKRRGLYKIAFRRKFDKWLKIALLILSAIMIILVILL